MVDDDPCSGRPSTNQTDENVSHVCDLFISDRRMSDRLLGDTLNFPKIIVHTIVTVELNKGKVCTKLVPKLLTD